MENAHAFVEKIRQGQVCVGTNVTLNDPVVSEALCRSLDFLWIDTEHNPLPLDCVQGHIMATKGSQTAPLVRVPWNDPVLVKPVLDIGAAGVIVPFVRTAEEARRAVSACRYPPDGIRGYGPRRPSGYGRKGGAEYCRLANETVLCFVQIEHVEAVRNLTEILAVPGLDGIAIGPMDLSGSLGHMAQPQHPAVKEAITHVIRAARKTHALVGIAIGHDLAQAQEWINLGVQWISLGCDYTFMLETADRLAGQIHQQTSHVPGRMASVAS